MAIATHEITRVEAVDMLRKMWRIRHFETKVIDLFQDGKDSRSTHTCIGMEESAVGAMARSRSGEQDDQQQEDERQRERHRQRVVWTDPARLDADGEDREQDRERDQDGALARPNPAAQLFFQYQTIATAMTMMSARMPCSTLPMLGPPPPELTILTATARGAGVSDWRRSVEPSLTRSCALGLPGDAKGASPRRAGDCLTDLDDARPRPTETDRDDIVRPDLVLALAVKRKHARTIAHIECRIRRQVSARGHADGLDDSRDNRSANAFTARFIRNSEPETVIIVRTDRIQMGTDR